jgi:DNA processing protein
VNDSARFAAAALVCAIGRAAAARVLAAGEDPVAAFRRLRDRDPGMPTPQSLAADCRRFDIDLRLPGDDGFPASLAAIADPPAVLFARGDPGCLLRPAVAIVGARRCTPAGAEVAAAMAGDLAARGVVVVSGLARGIDTAAHRAAAAAGVTVAVVGSGLARPYPTGNRQLLRSIVGGGGLLLSEYPPLAGARKHYFPERNRLISGLVRGVVVVEAGEHSGSLITARLALEQGRDVCAVPGSVINPVSRGCHRLLREGAALVETADDVLEALGLAASPVVTAAGQAASAGLEAGLAAVLAAVEARTTPVDQVVAATGLSAAAAAAALVELELGGFVRQVAGGYIRRPRF